MADIEDLEAQRKNFFFLFLLFFGEQELIEVCKST